MGSIAPFYLIGLALWLTIRLRQGEPLAELIPKVAFLIYVLGASRYVLFPLRFDRGFVLTMRAETSLSDGINIVPLIGLADVNGRQILGNVMLGVPFGALWPFVNTRARSLTRVIGAGAIAFTCVELVQLLISLAYGFAYRVIDINDVLLNVTGVTIGGLIIGVLALVLKGGKSPEPGLLPTAWEAVLRDFSLSGSTMS